MLKITSVVTAILTVLLMSSFVEAGEVSVSVVFGKDESSIIRTYYREHGTQDRGKKGKSKGLPPGIARNLQRGKALPPGIAKQTLPSGLVDLLPPPPSGYERVVLSGKVLLVEVATQIIHDVLEDLIIGH